MLTAVDLINNKEFEAAIDKVMAPLILNPLISMDICRLASDLFVAGYLAGFNIANTQKTITPD